MSSISAPVESSDEQLKITGKWIGKRTLAVQACTGNESTAHTANFYKKNSSLNDYECHNPLQLLSVLFRQENSSLSFSSLSILPEAPFNHIAGRALPARFLFLCTQMECCFLSRRGSLPLLSHTIQQIVYKLTCEYQDNENLWGTGGMMCFTSKYEQLSLEAGKETNS